MASLGEEIECPYSFDGIGRTQSPEVSCQSGGVAAHVKNRISYLFIEKARNGRVQAAPGRIQYHQIGGFKIQRIPTRTDIYVIQRLERELSRLTYPTELLIVAFVLARRYAAINGG